MRKPNIIIDVAHGGKDFGGGTNAFWKEKDKSLDISFYQLERLKYFGFTVALTRTVDKYLGSKARTKIVRNSKADICISNHINAGKGDGFEVIHSIHNDGKLANTIAREIVAKGQNLRRVFDKSRYDGKDYYYMHRETGRVTTLILEYGFADSTLDDVVQIQEHWKEYAEAVVKAICEFYGVKYTQPSYTGEDITKLVEFLEDNEIEVTVAEQAVALYKEKLNVPKFKKIRKFDSDIYYYESKPGEKLVVDLGKPWYKEVLTSLVRDNKYDEVASVNGQFFNFGGQEWLGSLGFNKLHYGNPDPTFMDCIIHADGKMEVKHIKGNPECITLQAEGATYFGTSWALVIDGVKGVKNAVIDHSKYKHPRTVIGQTENGAYILAVADGRTKSSKGLTAQEEAHVMYDLGCVNAVNMDGGGSSTFVMNGKVVNKPSGRVQRSIGTAIHIVKEG